MPLECVSAFNFYYMPSVELDQETIDRLDDLRIEDESSDEI
nr:hypothetical protein [Halomicrobium urmianum]